ncbi:hypothetical protein IB229_12275 [Pseudomonas sp. PDM14]|uniref:hypothetical protein n=1 Tax=Pseudomonas sp. PDM14 TaxID=2769288 RepID=UPI001783FAB5|nr:hypothetical protein [Pseudomonas sp. PDM14]MBD9483755.1 hypothetical protein [Pseudomonas sp. PDM14]
MKFDRNTPDHTPTVVIYDVVQVKEHQHAYTNVHSSRTMAGNPTIQSSHHLSNTCRLWLRDPATELETTFEGAGPGQYREGHKIALAHYANAVVAHQNLNTGVYVTIQKQAPQKLSHYPLILFMSWLAAALSFVFFFVGLSNWNRGRQGIDVVTANPHHFVPWPGGAHYTSLNGKTQMMILGPIAVITFSGVPIALKAAAIFWGGMALSLVAYQIIKAAYRNRIDFQAHVLETVKTKTAACIAIKAA